MSTDRAQYLDRLARNAAVMAVVKDEFRRKVEEFEENPSAANFRRLEWCMCAFQVCDVTRRGLTNNQLLALGGISPERWVEQIHTWVRGA